MDFNKRVYILAGHYGSGKTNVAVNLALKIKEKGVTVKIADLDIVNPYFRTKDSKKELDDANIELISPAYANTNVDLPALPQEVYSLVHRRDAVAVLDVGGDDRGAYALGRYAPYILEENDYEMCFVVNFYRPLTTTAKEAYEVMLEIERAAGIKFTSIIQNSNLGNDTTKEQILATKDKLNELSALTGLKILFTSVKKDVAKDMDEEVLELQLQKKYFDII